MITQKNRSPAFLIAAAVFVSCLCFSIIRDYRNLKDGYTCDLRKRVMGARYQAAGLSPYYYKWKPGDTERFCDPYETGKMLEQNVVTLPPSYTWALQPLAKLDFPVAEKTWFVLQYFFFMLLTGMFYYINRNNDGRIFLMVAAALFLLSRGWILNVDVGQSYIIFPLLLGMGYLKFNEYGKPQLVTAGIVLALCCWLRPLFALYCIPFLFSKELKYFIWGFAVTALVCLLQIVLLGQYADWIDFFRSSKSWLDFFASGQLVYNDDISNIIPLTIEGQSDFSITALPDYNASLPVLLKYLISIKIPNFIYSVIQVIISGFILLKLYKSRKSVLPWQIWMAGFLVYYTAEIFMLVPKTSYYFVEITFPVYLLLTNMSNKKIIYMLAFGLFLSGLFFKLIPMQLLIAELFMYFVLMFGLIHSLNPKKVTNKYSG